MSRSSAVIISQGSESTNARGTATALALDPRVTAPEQHPDLVKKYTQFLETQLAANQTLAQRFTRSKDSGLNPEQLRTLRSLGYIQ